MNSFRPVKVAVPQRLSLADIREVGKDPLTIPIAMHEQHGDILFSRVGPGLVPIYMVRSLEHIDDALVKNRDAFHKGLVLNWLRPVFGNSILVSEGDHWRRNRRLMSPSFARKALQRYADIMVTTTERALGEIEPGKPFAINHWTMVVTLEIVLECLFGAELGDRAQIVERALEDALFFADDVIRRLLPLPNWVPTQANRARKRAMDALNGVVDEIIAARVASGETREDLLGMLLATRDEEGNAMPYQELREEVITLLLAGHETTALNIAYLFMVLGWRQDVQEELDQELHEVLAGASPTMADLPKLPKLDQALKESLRMYPPAAVFSRQAIADTTMGEWQIPQWSQILVSVWAIHHDPRWYPDPNTFRLDRWTAEEEAKRPKLSFMPFGVGNRVCIGEQFARMEAKLITACILQRFRVRTLNSGDPRFKLTVTLRAVDQVMVVMEPRESAAVPA